MQNKETYEYAIIRLVPKVEREEFINIGVIVYSKKKKFLGIRYQVDPVRVNSFAIDVDLEMVNNYLAAWQLICEGSLEGGKIAALEQGYRFRWLVAAKSTIIQCSPTHPGLSHNPGDLLDELFTNYVLQ